MQIQTLNANLGGAVTAPLNATAASANQSPGTPLPKVVFEAILAELANPNQKSTESFGTSAQPTGVSGKVYATDSVSENEHLIDPNLIESFPFQALANTDLSPASTNLTNALMHLLSSSSSNPLANSKELSNSSMVQLQPFADTEAGLKASSMVNGPSDRSALSQTEISIMPLLTPDRLTPTAVQNPTSSPEIPSPQQPGIPFQTGDAVAPPNQPISIAENPVSTSEIASFVPIRSRPTSGPKTESSETVNPTNASHDQTEKINDSRLLNQAPVRTPQTQSEDISTSASEINSDSSGSSDRSMSSTVETTKVVSTDSRNASETNNRLFSEELNPTDIQVTAESRPTAESGGPTVSVANSSSVEHNLEPALSATEPATERIHPVEVNSNLEVKPNTETLLRDYKIPQVAEKTISEVVSEIVAQRNIESQRGDEVTRIRIEIDPPELGEISIEISRHPHQTVATIVVANEHAQQQLSGNIQQLQTSLESMGVEFKQVDIQQPVPEQDPFNPTERDSSFQNETPDRSHRDSSNPAERKQEDLHEGSGENTPENNVSIRSVHVVDVLI